MIAKRLRILLVVLMLLAVVVACKGKEPSNVRTITGSGSSVINVDVSDSFYVIHIVAAEGAGLFMVTRLNAASQGGAVIVCTDEPYDGYWFGDPRMPGLEISTPSRDWTVEIIPLDEYAEFSGHVLDVPGTYQGNGDDVVVFRGTGLDDKARISNSMAGRFLVDAVSKDQVAFLVESWEQGEYTRKMPSNALLMTVRTMSSWSVEVTH